MSLIRKTFKIADVLTDMTSVKLSDRDATYGVKRNDTAAVVVADDTAMTKVSTGVYEHTFTDPANDLEYTYWLEVTYGGETYWVQGIMNGPATPSGSGLVLSYTDLMSCVAHSLGWGRDTTVLTSKQTADCDAFVQSGYRQFLYPPPLEGGVAHEWSFLCPIKDMNTVATDADYDLDADFGGVVGDITIDDQGLYYPIPQRPESVIRDLRQKFAASGRPKLFAVRPKAFDATVGQRWELLIWPEPDGVYPLQWQQNVQVNQLSSVNLYPIGGGIHSETLQQSCLAVAELEKEDQKGVHWDRFLHHLAASISKDRQLAPRNLGYNRDASDDKHRLWVRAQYVEYEGTVYY